MLFTRKLYYTGKQQKQFDQLNMKVAFYTKLQLLQLGVKRDFHVRLIKILITLNIWYVESKDMIYSST